VARHPEHRELDMTRLQAGALVVRREWVPLEEVVGSALNRLEAQLSRHTVKADLPGDLPLLEVDPLLFSQVLTNLLENAAKHTPPGSSVEVAARATPAAVILEVADDGAGIPAGQEETIFEKFQRGPEAKGAGAGLGLAICRGIVAAHGGTITAENRAGGGALFRVTLPRTGRAPTIPPPAPEEQAA
jgi:two-component system sensor histidine kinase KdpD